MTNQIEFLYKVYANIFTEEINLNRILIKTYMLNDVFLLLREAVH